MKQQQSLVFRREGERQRETDIERERTERQNTTRVGSAFLSQYEYVLCEEQDLTSKQLKVEGWAKQGLVHARCPEGLARRDF